MLVVGNINAQRHAVALAVKETLHLGLGGRQLQLAPERADDPQRRVW
jgi:hypothetical protein